MTKSGQVAKKGKKHHTLQIEVEKIEVTKFRTYDGKAHDSEKDAKKHLIREFFQEKFDEATVHNETDFDEFFNSIMEEDIRLIDLLQLKQKP